MLTDKQLEERLEYARTHTKEEWAKKFGLSLATATSYYASHRMTKRKTLVSAEDILPLAQEHNQAEIATILGVGRPLVSRCCRINGIKCKKEWRRKKSLSEKNRAILEYAEKHTMAEAARKFKVSRQWVFILKRANRNEDEEDTTGKSTGSF